MNKSGTKIEIENINTSGHVSQVDSVKYHDMKNALLQVIPKSSPGLTHKEIMEKILPHISPSLFPTGQKRGWWPKTVQLDLEAKRIIIREVSKPLRWYMITE